MLIMGCDLHTRYQEIALLDTATGEVVTRRLEHENGEARASYASLPEHNRERSLVPRKSGLIAPS